MKKAKFVHMDQRLRNSLRGSITGSLFNRIEDRLRWRLYARANSVRIEVEDDLGWVPS
jgi:hypothetical protein